MMASGETPVRAALAATRWWKVSGSARMMRATAHRSASGC